MSFAVVFSLPYSLFLWLAGPTVSVGRREKEWAERFGRDGPDRVHRVLFFFFF
jgi:hypothetical protein